MFLSSMGGRNLAFDRNGPSGESHCLEPLVVTERGVVTSFVSWGRNRGDQPYVFIPTWAERL